MINNDNATSNTIYDNNNIFARILRGELPCDKIYENEYALAFHDINPQAPVHVIIIPKGHYMSMDDFTDKASTEEIAGFIRAVGKIARLLGLAEPGYRCLTNCGSHSGQEVFHLHIHLFGGQPLGPILARDK